MDKIILDAVLGEDHRLILDVPADVPAGPVKVMIYPQPAGNSSEQSNREQLRRKLRGVGKLHDTQEVPLDTIPPSDEERERLARVFSAGRSTLDLISEDRGEH